MIFLLLSFFDLIPHPKHRFKFQVSSIVFQFSFLSSLGFALFVPPFTSHLSPTVPLRQGGRARRAEGVDKTFPFHLSSFICHLSSVLNCPPETGATSP